MTTYEHPEKILSAVEAIDDAIQLTSDVHGVLGHVIQRVRDIFQCDRAWLFYPCNPDIASFNVTYESTTVDYPGAKALMADVPMTHDMADYCRRALSDLGRPQCDPPAGHVISNDIAIRFNVKSLMFMALRPQSGDAWMLGIHQCDHDRIWTEHDRQLFRIIGSRITDCLSSMLYLNRLKEREEKYRSLFEGSRDAIVVTGRLGEIRDANPAALSLFGYTRDALLNMNFQQLYVDPNEGIRFQKEIREKIWFRILKHASARMGIVRWIASSMRSPAGTRTASSWNTRALYEI
ncbi:MAG: PAS domain S-box protein [Deltaproteobacteria bacterium]|nr:PAS domain S-box protein [Deltaproteobacteria bacterium]